MRIPNVDDLKSKITAGKGYANPSLYYIQLPARNLNGEQKQSIEYFVRNPSDSAIQASVLALFWKKHGTRNVCGRANLAEQELVSSLIEFF